MQNDESGTRASVAGLIRHSAFIIHHSAFFCIGALMSYRSFTSRASPLVAGVLLATLAVPAWAPRAMAEDAPAAKPAKKEKAAAGDLADRPNQVTGNEITPAQQQAVEKGLAWLSKRLTDN